MAVWIWNGTPTTNYIAANSPIAKSDLYALRTKVSSLLLQTRCTADFRTVFTSFFSSEYAGNYYSDKNMDHEAHRSAFMQKYFEGGNQEYHRELGETCAAISGDVRSEADLWPGANFPQCQPFYFPGDLQEREFV